jgi:hypothetical protein
LISTSVAVASQVSEKVFIIIYFLFFLIFQTRGKIMKLYREKMKLIGTTNNSHEIDSFSFERAEPSK